MGWDGIITYNYDDFMEQALLDLQTPSAAIAMRGDEIAGDPTASRDQSGQVGYTSPSTIRMGIHRTDRSL
jgi:hypothetical protein